MNEKWVKNNMKKNMEEKSLVPVNEKNIFYKIKKFLKGMFQKRTSKDASNLEQNETKVEATDREAFVQSIKNIGKEKREALELQKKYNDGQVKINDLTKEQIDSLSLLYKEQTEELRQSNERRKRRINEYKQHQKNH